MIDIGPLHRSIARLEEGLARYRADPADTQIRDGLIQRFEFTYELSHKMLKRYLAFVSANPGEFDAMTFPDLIRAGGQQGLLRGEWAAWRGFRDMRARTSHTYDEETALAVVAALPGFLAEAVFLRDRLRERLP